MPSAEKITQLQQWGVLNTKPESIKNSLFNQYSFFDPYDLLQVKYEMLRHVYIDGWGITEVILTIFLTLIYLILAPL
jgi:hypothetical protein